MHDSEFHALVSMMGLLSLSCTGTGGKANFFGR
jgi:hypothetical protein